MNKKVRTVMNILLAIAGLVFLVSLIDMFGSIKYANRETEDPVERNQSVFEYKLKHKAYGEIVSTYYTERLDSFEAAEGMEDIYRVSEYAHTAFMSKVYEEKGDNKMASANASRREKLKNSLGAYAYTAEEVDDIISGTEN